MAKNIETNKGIVWRRGSTSKQEIETQGKDLTEIAVKEGFNPSNLIYIGAAGASAIKQNDLYMQEVNELLTTLENDKSVKTVFVWEISRLARVELAFYQMKDYLIKNHIQLICRTPSLRLFDNDGTVNKGTELTLSLLVTLAKQEMEIKFERFARGKARNKAEGKYNGGKIKMGYKLNAEKRFEIDEEKADLVRKIYAMYLNDDCSCNYIYHHFVELGIFKIKNRLQAGSKVISRIMNDKAYIGEGLYPRIIDNETFEKAQVKMSKHCIRHTASHIYYCSGLLVDNVTNTRLSARHGTLVYQLRYVDRIYALNINALDYACWFVASYLKNTNLKKQGEENKVEYSTRIEENKIKIENKTAQIDELQAKIDRAIEMNIDNPKHFSTEKMKAVVDRCDAQIEALKKEIADLTTDNARMEQILSGIDTVETAIDFAGEYTDEMKKEIINSVIEKISVERLEDRKFKLQFINKIGYIDNSYFIYETKGHKVYMWFVDANGAKIDFTDEISKNKRFERKRYNGK